MDEIIIGDVVVAWGIGAVVRLVSAVASSVPLGERSLVRFPGGCGDYI